MSCKFTSCYDYKLKIVHMIKPTAKSGKQQAITTYLIFGAEKF